MSSQPKHTKGPWSRNIKPASHYPIIFAGRNTHVAQVISKGLTTDEIEANCDLIAAAPELLEALKSLLEYPLEGYSEFRINQLRELIKKAEGK